MDEKQKNAERKEKIKKFFNDKNLLLRIISVLCAILLWFYVSEVESPTAEKTFEGVNITVKNKDVLLEETDLSIISDSFFQTTVVLSGKRSTLNKIDYDNIEATIDISRITEAGVHELKVTVVPPAGTNLSSVNPRNISVTVDKTVAKSFEIEPDISYSNLPSDYTLGDCVITDNQSKAITTVTVSGPATEVEKIEKVVAKVDFGSINGSVEAKTDLVLLGNFGEELSTDSVKLSTPSVKVKQPVSITKILPLETSQAYGTFAKTQITFDITPSRVEVKGDPKILGEMTSIKLDPINEKSIGETLTTTVNTLIKVPEELELVTLQNTATITARLKNVNCHEIEIKPSDIKVVGLPGGSEVEFKNMDSKIIVVNSTSKDITLDDLSLTLDLSTFPTSGLYTVFLTPTFKKDISYAYLPYANFSITFELTHKEG